MNQKKKAVIWKKNNHMWKVDVIFISSYVNISYVKMFQFQIWKISYVNIPFVNISHVKMFPVLYMKISYVKFMHMKFSLGKN